MEKYTVVKAFEHDGRTVLPGETVELGRKAAKYLVLNGKAAKAAAGAEKKPAGVEKKEAEGAKDNRTNRSDKTDRTDKAEPVGKKEA
jgi:hypothetical protein